MNGGILQQNNLSLEIFCKLFNYKFNFLNSCRTIQMIYFILSELWQFVVFKEVVHFITAVKVMCVQLFMIFPYFPFGVFDLQIYNFYKIWKTFSHLCIQICFYSSPPPFWISNYTYVRQCDIVLLVTEVWVFCFVLFFSSFCTSLGQFQLLCLQVH